MTEETKKKISESLKGKKKSPQHKIKISYGMKEAHRRKRIMKKLNEQKEIDTLRQNCQ
jgi:hypothetical protein